MARIVETIGVAALAPPLWSANNASEPVWQPAFLTSEQNEALVSLGECIVPGSAAAFCNRLIDLVLSIESKKTKQQMTDALAQFDREARAHHGNNFRNLKPEQQAEILTAAARGDGALHGEFEAVKEWMADAYWSSEQGMRELGWKGRVAWASFDGCPHAAKHSAGQG